MRRALDRLYDGAAYLAALFMIGTLAMVMLGIIGRWLDWFIAGTDSYAGYCMAGAGFLALAHTLKRGEHIRVTLILERLAPRGRHRLELFALAAGTLLAIAFAWYSARLAYQSYDFNDVSTGNDATPLWIPQLTMALGAIVLAIAFVDELLLEWAGQRHVTTPEEALHNE
ncbi:MAG TPA: TRAP transporter small permease [Casimicrobiaceae bacterium]|nr:TRAP transporter small permease [Casimicrobiaceae bacterium]